MAQKRDVLVHIPSCRAFRDTSGAFWVDRKFFDGVLKYCEYWPRGVRVVMAPSATNQVGFDSVRVRASDLPFELIVLDLASKELERYLEDAAVVLAMRCHGIPLLAERCARRDVACVYVTEYTLSTRLQIMMANTKHPFYRLRRGYWEIAQERHERRELRRAHGVQCNGMPTYLAYRRLNPNAMVYFDTRVDEAMIAREADLASRLARLNEHGPLRLAFSGRLTAMKGVDHLPELARELTALGVNYKLSIAGHGELEHKLRGEVARLGLEHCVEFKGALDFKTELVPFMKNEVDLFVCPHVQGDPSCTYLEVLACGVPVAGFANEAFRGILQQADVGFAGPVGHTRALAATIKRLAHERSLLAGAAQRALAFARQHTFESTFRARVAHLEASVERLRRERARGVAPTRPFAKLRESRSV